MRSITKRIYITEDGKEFFDRKEAEKHDLVLLLKKEGIVQEDIPHIIALWEKLSKVFEHLHYDKVEPAP